MPKFELNKLVRDGIPAKMEALGQKSLTYALSESERAKALRSKILEEATEISAASKKTAYELADLQEAILALGALLGHTPERLEQLRLERRANDGGFDDGAFVTLLDIPEDDSWVEYYRAEPERFPELKDD